MKDTRAIAVAPFNRVRRLTRRQGAPPGGADPQRRENEALRGADALRRENEALRRHAARLSAAVRRIGASLDAASARARRDGPSRAGLLDAAGRRLLTPLTSIKGSTATALDAPAALDRSGMLQLLRIIDEQADRMGDLIDGRLESHEIGAGNGGMGDRLEAHAIEARGGETATGWRRTPSRPGSPETARARGPASRIRGPATARPAPGAPRADRPHPASRVRRRRSGARRRFRDHPPGSIPSGWATSPSTTSGAG